MERLPKTKQCPHCKAQISFNEFKEMMEKLINN